MQNTRYDIDIIDMYIFCGRTPRGVRGLKCEDLQLAMDDNSRTPRGVRGLKYLLEGADRPLTPSHPAWGAWIEI